MNWTNILKENNFVIYVKLDTQDDWQKEKFTFNDRTGKAWFIRSADTKLGSVIKYENVKGTSRLRRLAIWNSDIHGDRKMKKAQFFINIVGSEFGLSESTIRETINYHKLLVSKNIFTHKMTYEERAASLGYLTMREYGYSYSLKEVSKRLDVPSKRVGKLARLYARHLGKSHVFATNNITSLIEKYCSRFTDDRIFMKDIEDLFNYINRFEFYHPTPSYLSGLTYFVETLKPSRKYSQGEIAKAYDVTIQTCRLRYKNVKKILQIKDTFGLQIKDIIEGIR